MFRRSRTQRQSEEMLQRLQRLPPRFQRMVTQRNYPLDLVEQVAMHIGYEDYPDRVAQLPLKFQSMVLHEDYPLDLAEEIVRLSSLPLHKRAEAMFTAQQAAAFMYPMLLECCLTDNGLMALREGLITPEYAASVWTVDALSRLLSDHSLRQLRRGHVRLSEPIELSEVSELTEFTEDVNVAPPLRRKN